LLFYYSQDNFNNQDVIIQKEQIKQFTASIETVFVHYHLARKNKMAEGIKLTEKSAEVFNYVKANGGLQDQNTYDLYLL